MSEQVLVKLSSFMRRVVDSPSWLDVVVGVAGGSFEYLPTGIHPDDRTTGRIKDPHGGMRRPGSTANSTLHRYYVPLGTRD